MSPTLVSCLSRDADCLYRDSSCLFHFRGNGKDNLHFFQTANFYKQECSVANTRMG